MRRRDFMRAAGGATVATAATAGTTGSALATEEEEEEDSSGGEAPDYGPYLDDARGLETARDLRGQEEVTVEVGAGSDGLAFNPAGIWIAPGTTVTWEWTGEGGAHNVVANEGPAGLDSGDPVGEEGATYEYEFTEEDAGITTYRCEPHEGQGMKGGIAVGDDVPTVSTGGSELKDPAEFGVDIHEHWVGVTVVMMIIVSLTFTFFALKYGESAHTSGGN